MRKVYAISKNSAVNAPKRMREIATKNATACKCIPPVKRQKSASS